MKEKKNAPYNLKIMDYLFSSVIKRYLGPFILNFSMSNVDINLIRFSAEVRNLLLNSKMLEDLDLPIRLKFGMLGSLKLKMKGFSLEEGFIIEIENIFICVENLDIKDWKQDIVTEKYQASKLSYLTK